LAVLAHFGDSEAIGILWTDFYSHVQRFAKSFGRRYAHIDADDLGNSVALRFPKIIERYDPKRRNYDKWVGITIFRECQDELRKYDPLGVSIPQKSHYPAFAHLSAFDYLDSEAYVTGVVEDGLERLDRGYTQPRLPEIS